MEKSNLPEAVLNLGQQFVNKLGLEPGVDTFGRWMAYYIAEQMVKAEHAKGMEKEAAEKNCFDTILKFWQHRWELPAGLRPFESFESILSLIERLDPERRKNFYYHQLPEQEDLQESVNDIQSHWIKFANDVDKAARVSIEFAIEKCAKEAKDSETNNWLKYGSAIETGIDTEIIGKLSDIDLSAFLDKNEENEVTTKKKKEKIFEKYSVEKIKTRIQHLEQFSKLNSIVLEELKATLKKKEK